MWADKANLKQNHSWESDGQDFNESSPRASLARSEWVFN